MTVAPERTTLSVRPVAGHIGADISGVDLSAPLDEETVAGLTAALHRYKVIFFREQELDHAAQIRFGRHFGELTYAHPHDDAPPEGHPEIFTVDPERYAKRYGALPPLKFRRCSPTARDTPPPVTAPQNCRRPRISFPPMARRCWKNWSPPSAVARKVQAAPGLDIRDTDGFSSIVDKGMAAMKIWRMAATAAALLLSLPVTVRGPDDASHRARRGS